MNLPTNTIVSLPAVTGRYIMAWRDLGSGRFPYDKDGDGPQNISLLTIQPPNVAAIPDFRFKTSVMTFI
jgi:hypothetical protein